MKGKSIEQKEEMNCGDKPASFNLIATKRVDSTVPDLRPGEPATVNLDPCQVEEIHADDYSLLLFSATRIEPLSISEIKHQFPEPNPRKAQSVMDRFVSVGLVHVTKEGKYYSNYPHDYVNWGKYRYEADIEARKDAKVFQLVKDFFGIKSYWQNKVYFSLDAFFTPEQSEELKEMIFQLKVKAKQYANENAKAGKLSDMKFRRIKFYDMVFGFLFAILLSFGAIDNSYARGGSGTDPVSFKPSEETSMMFAVGSGTDAKIRQAIDECLSDSDVRLMKAVDVDQGGGGHDPTEGPGRRMMEYKPSGNGTGGGGHDTGTKVNYTDEACKLNTLLDFVRKCRGLSNQFCEDVRTQSINIWRNLKKEPQGWDI